MHDAISTPADETQSLLTRLYAFCFPGGEGVARIVRKIRTTQQGEIRMSPQARWLPFVAEEVTDATRSNFCWEARLKTSKIISPTVTDAYQEGHGRLVVKVAGGLVPVRKVTGLDADKGEIQRYLSSVAFCPSILLNHSSIDCTAVAPLTLRVRDRKDPTGASVNICLSEEGQPLSCHADRPHIFGKQAVITPRSATASDFLDWEGPRVATRLEVSWHLPEGPFTYYRSEIAAFTSLS